jgi:hypothetical protein
VGCYEADHRVAGDLTRLDERLRGIPVPAQYKSAAAETLQAIGTEIHALELRMHSLEAGGHTKAERDAWFSQSKALFVEARGRAQHAYTSFPQWARPTPAPTV